MKKASVRIKAALFALFSLVGATGLLLTNTEAARSDQLLLSKVDQQTSAEKPPDCIGI